MNLLNSNGKTPQLRGVNVTNRSYGIDINREADQIDPVARTYFCESGHGTVMPFAPDAEYPSEWECTTCYRVAMICDADEDGATDVEIVRSETSRPHIEHVYERRSQKDLRALLEERLDELRKRSA